MTKTFVWPNSIDISEHIFQQILYLKYYQKVVFQHGTVNFLLRLRKGCANKKTTP